jgi:hypothetical protein
LDGIYRNTTSWKCRCCNTPVRHTPYAGRKALEENARKFNIDLYGGPTINTIDV